MNDTANALERARWYQQFVAGDFAGAASHMAPDLVRDGPRVRDANNVIKGRDAYIAFLTEVYPTQKRIHESFVEEITASPDGTRSYVRCTEIDSLEPNSAEKTVAIRMLIENHINDEGLISRIDVFWKDPGIHYEWTGTED
jgi:hypothetical protein